MSVEHIVVLCLENRSFDHMLGYLPHPNPAFAGLRGGALSNPDASGTPIPASPDATAVLPFGPDHSHDAVMAQLALAGPPWNRVPTHQGFVGSYERKTAGQHPPRFGGVFGWARRLLHRPQPGATGRGPLVMRCQSSERVPVLATLAIEFAVFDHWYCSVPGETWPNRNYLHAATSDGETNIVIRPYTNRTIFELLEDHGHDWRIYHDGMAQAWAYPALWDTPERHAKWWPIDTFADHVQAEDLPAYSFIEPRHQPPSAPLDQLQAARQLLGTGNSQHPENNLVDNTAYDSFTPQSETDFDRGERLLASVYEALRTNPTLFASTVLVVTYDEHGGLYDHLPAPERVPSPGDHKTLLARLFDSVYRESATRFDFTRLGVRVPTVVISPLIPAATLESALFEHASVPATLRAVFAPDAGPLTGRDAHARSFNHLWAATQVRTDLPDLSAHTQPPTAPRQAAQRPPGSADAPPPPTEPSGWTPDYYTDFLQQADAVRQHLRAVGEPEAMPLTDPTTRFNQEAVVNAFTQAGHRHRVEHTMKQPGPSRPG